MPHLTLRRLSAIVLCIALPLNSTIADSSVPGGIYTYEVPEHATSITFEGKPVMRLANTVFVGIPMSTEPGTHQLHYTEAGSPQIHEFEVINKQYTEQHLTIANQAMVDPPAETLARIREESTRQRRLYNSFSDTTDLSLGFIKPLQGVTTSLFGHRRFFNGQPRNPHSGLDIAADTGTPIIAAGNGTISLADDLYFNGNTLFVDHGQGLITMYCHMSKLLVEEGQQVSQGEEIGLVGATGRVTGPHLHWSVSLNGTRVDPEIFMATLSQHLADTQPSAR